MREIFEGLPLDRQGAFLREAGVDVDMAAKLGIGERRLEILLDSAAMGLLASIREGSPAKAGPT